MAKTRRRLRRAAVIGLEVLAGATLGFLVLMGVTIWRLSEGPIEINFLSATIEEALSDPDHGMTVGIGTTQLTWEGWSRGLDIHLIDVIARNAEGDSIAEVDDMTVAFSLQALSRGELSPTSLEVIAPSVFLTYHADGSVSVGRSVADEASEDAAAAEDAEQERFASAIVEELMREPQNDRQFGELRSFIVRDANLRVLDEVNGATWETPGANIIMRRDANGLNLEAAMAIKLAGEVTFFDISGYFDRSAETVRLAVGFDRIDPSTLANQSPYLRDLAALDLPVSGQVETVLSAGDADFTMRLEMAFAETTGTIVANGHYGVADEMATVDYAVTGISLSELSSRLPWLAPLAGFDLVVDGQAQLVVDPGGVESAGFGFTAGTGTITLPNQFDNPLEVSSIRLEGAMAGGGDALDISRAEIQFGSAAFSGSGTAFADDVANYDVAISGSLSGLAVEDIGRYWPTEVAANARNWVKRRIPAGMFDRIDVDLYGTLDVDAYTFEPMETGLAFAFSDLSLLYIEEMPALEGVNGRGRYDGTELRVEIDEGARTFDLTTSEALVVMNGFENPLPYARITGSLAGDVRNHFRVLDHEPLSFLGGYGIAPEQVRGTGTVKLDIGFDVDEVVPLEAIQIAVQGNLSGATIPGIVGGNALTDAALQVTANNDRMEVTGTGAVNGTEVEFTRTENFGGGDYLAQSTLRGVFGVDTLATLGLDLAEWVSGPVGFAARFSEYRNNTERADIALDLTSAAMAIPALEWTKDAGSSATAAFSLALQDSAPVAIEQFDLDAGSLQASGRLQFTSEGDVHTVDLSNLAVGRTQVAGRIELLANNGIDVRLDGGVLDLVPLREREDEALGDPNRILTITAVLDRIWVNENGYLNQVSGNLQFVGSRWFEGAVEARASNGVPVQVSLEPTENGRFFRATTDDAGTLLSDLDLTQSLRGGRLVISARVRENEPGRPLVGDLDISDFRLVDAPLLARIISIAGVTGILDALEGEGIGFGRLSTTFRRSGNLMELREGRMVGASLGVTFDGTVDTENDVLDLRGAVAPAYAVNGILGEIPLVGDVLVGGEGEGIFALTYEASGAAGDPQVAVNPLSALTPGFMRNIFPGG